MSRKADDPRKRWRPRRRPEAVRAAVVAQVTALLANHRARMQAGNATPEDTFLLRTILKDRLCWAWTMAPGGDAFTKFAKLLAQPRWSEGALRSYARHGDAVLRGRRAESLVHEHVVPRAALCDALMALPEPSEVAVREVLERLGVACVVTVEEDRRMTAVAVDLADPWHRYREAGVGVVQIGELFSG